MNRKHQSGFVHLIIVVLILLVLGALVFVYFKSQAVDKNSNNAKTSENSYSDWQVFENKNDAYIVKYPTGWVEKSYQDNSTKPVHNYFQPSSDSDFGIDIQSNVSSSTPEEYANTVLGSIKKLAIIDSDKSTINHKESYCFRSYGEDSNSRINHFCFIKNDDKIFQISMTEKDGEKNYAKYTDTFLSLVKSMRFVD